MAIVTTYDQEINEWKNKLELATDVATVTNAVTKLHILAARRWNSVEDLNALSAEIDARLRAYKSDSDNEGIYKASYQRWKEILKKGVDADSLRAARNLLIQADQTVFARLAQNRTKYLENHPVVTDDELKEHSTVTGGGSENTQTTLGGGVSTTTRDNNGIYTLKTDKDTVTVKDDGSRSNTTSSTTNTATNKNAQDPNYLDRRPAWIDTNIEYHRIKTSKGLSVDSAYIKRYYSVIDAEIYFGNEYVEDIADINWSIKQNVTPLFGYNSYTYDDIARGNRIIFGSFLINFTSPNYLFSILEEANKANVTSITNMKSYTVPLLQGSAKPRIRSGTVGSRERGHHANIWPQTFDIDIIFGEKTAAGDPVHILILGCAIQDCQMALSASTAGSPPVVMERYSFIAQDIKTVVGENTTQSTANSTTSNSVTSAQSDNDSLNVVSADNTDLSSLSNLKVSNENKEMAEYYKQQQEKAKEKEAIKQAVNTAIANAKAAQINDEADKEIETRSKIHNVISSITGEDIPDADNFVIRAKQINGMLLTYMEYIDTALTKYNTGKPLSDDTTAVLLSRYDNGEKLSLQEKQDLEKKIRIAEARGEWYFYNDDEQEYIAIPYNANYNGQSKSGVVLFEYDKDIDVSIFGSGSAFDN